MMTSIRSFARSVFYFFHICLDKIRGVDFYTYKDCPPSIPNIGNRYETSSPLFYRYIKESVSTASHERDALIDVGCGKGHMLEFFSKLGFGCVDGLEYLPELAEIGKSNMRRLGLSSKIFVGDAAEWEDYDTYNYVFMFNPFPENVMNCFAAKLRKSIERTPREVTILYVNPYHIANLEAHGFFLQRIIRKKHGSMAIFSSSKS